MSELMLATRGDVQPSVAATPTDPPWTVVAKVCASECATPSSAITVFRDTDGRAARLRFDGDLQRCSHPPRLYFDAEGRETLAIDCPDPGRCTPERTREFVSDAPCRTDEDCLACECRPVNRDEWNARGGGSACTIAGEECLATNGACCEGRCALAR